MLSAWLCAAAVQAAQTRDYWSDQERRSAERSEERISKWRPAKNYELPKGSVSGSPTDLVGIWRGCGRNEPECFVFEQGVNGQFSVKYTTAGCLDCWSYSRTARISECVVTLSRAVETYSDDIFDRMYFVWRNGKLYLLPAGSIELARELAKEYGDTVDYWFTFFALEKVKA